MKKVRPSLCGYQFKRASSASRSVHNLFLFVFSSLMLSLFLSFSFCHSLYVCLYSSFPPLSLSIPLYLFLSFFFILSLSKLSPVSSLFVRHFVGLFGNWLLVCLSVWLSACLSVCLSFCLLVSLFLSLSPPIFCIYTDLSPFSIYSTVLFLSFSTSLCALSSTPLSAPFSLSS